MAKYHVHGMVEKTEILYKRNNADRAQGGHCLLPFSEKRLNMTICW